MQYADFTQISCWQHLGDNRGDIVTDAPFVGDQSTLMTFDVNGNPLSGEPGASLLLIELFRSGSSTPVIQINGNPVNTSMASVGVSGVWEVWMVRNWSVNLVSGANTIQIFRPPGGDDFVVGNIAVFWHTEIPAPTPTSSGWRDIPASQWENIAGAGNQDFSDPSDLDILAVNSWWPIQGGNDSERSVIAVYLDDGRGTRQVPCRRRVTGGGKAGTVEFRYSFDSETNFAQWLDPVAALVEGDWDRDGYIKNTYLPSLKWRVAIVPAF